MPSKPSRSVASPLGIQYGSSTRPSRRRSASISVGMRLCAFTEGERSPTSASLAVVFMELHRPGAARSRPTMISGITSRSLMDPRFLRTFVVVARLGSFSAAARELGYTQSAVSQHIAVLESDLGTVLLTRRPVAPTEAGARPLAHAQPDPLRRRPPRAGGARGGARP